LAPALVPGLAPPRQDEQRVLLPVSGSIP
jgi:hypothetical protein